jgi:cation transport regulator ChaB
MKCRNDRREAVSEKDLYRAILNVLQSHFDSTNNSQDASRAMQAHEIGQDAVNDWLSAKLSASRLEFVGMMRD